MLFLLNFLNGPFYWRGQHLLSVLDLAIFKFLDEFSSLKSFWNLMEMTLTKNVFSDIKFNVSLHLELERILVKIVNFKEFIVMSASKSQGIFRHRVLAHKCSEDASNVFHVIVKSTFIFLVFSHWAH